MSAINFMVKYGIRRKIVRNEELCNICEDIKDAFKDLKGSFCIKFYHKDFDDILVDLDSPLQLLERSNNELVIADVEDASNSESDESLSNSSGDTLPVYDDEEERLYLEEEEEEGDDDTTDTNSNESSIGTDVSHVRWPVVFVVDENSINSVVLGRLNQRLLLNERERSSLFSSIFDQCSVKYGTCYPSSGQYNDIIKAILTRWVHLRNEFLNVDDAHVLWKHRIRNHFKNSRRRTPNHPQVASRKRKAATSNEEANVTRNNSSKIFLTWGVPNYLPNLPDGEDERTIACHVEKIKKELKLHKEFERLSNWKLIPQLRIGLAKYRDKINLQKVTNDNGRIEPLKTEVSLCRNEISRIYASNSLALMTIPFLLRENVMCLFNVESDNRQPRLRINVAIDKETPLVDIINAEKFDLLIEDYVIASSRDFVQAFATLMSAHYIFNVIYAKGIECTMSFIQKVILDLLDNIKVAPKVLNLISRLKKQ